MRIEGAKCLRISVRTAKIGKSKHRRDDALLQDEVQDKGLEGNEKCPCGFLTSSQMGNGLREGAEHGRDSLLVHVSETLNVDMNASTARVMSSMHTLKLRCWIDSTKEKPHKSPSHRPRFF